MYTVHDGAVGRVADFTVEVTWPQADLAYAVDAGTVTSVELPADGIASGGTVLYRVDLRPTVIACGDIPAFRTMTLGDAGPDIAQLQQLLIDLGHLSGEPTGHFSRGTARAVQAWQRSLGVEPTGVVEHGDLVFTPTLPARVLLADAAEVGSVLAGAEPMASAVLAAPTLSITVSSNSQLPPPGATVEVRFGEYRWEAMLGETLPASDESSDVRLAVITADGRPVCGEVCATLPHVAAGEVQATVRMVEEAVGPVVPMSAVGTDPVGNRFVVGADGEQIPVRVEAVDGSQVVVSGVNIGQAVWLFAVGDDRTDDGSPPTSPTSSLTPDEDS